MTYVIAQPCVDLKDRACVDECPVDCIYEGKRMLYIHPDECVDCGACEPVCPVEAIFYEDDTPEEWKGYYDANVHFFDDLGSPGGAAKMGVIDKPTTSSSPRCPRRSTTSDDRWRGAGLRAGLPDFPWDKLTDHAATARSHPDGVVDLSVGTPVDPTPEVVQQALRDAADSPGYPRRSASRPPVARRSTGWPAATGSPASASTACCRSSAPRSSSARWRCTSASAPVTSSATRRSPTRRTRSARRSPVPTAWPPTP